MDFYEEFVNSQKNESGGPLKHKVVYSQVQKVQFWEHASIVFLLILLLNFKILAV